MHRCAALVVALTSLSLAAGPRPARAADDRVSALAQTWTCRTASGATVRYVGTRSGESINVRTLQLSGPAEPAAVDQRYVWDAARGTWHVTTAPGTVNAVKGDAGPWSGERWTVDGVDLNGIAARIVSEALPDGDLRRSYETPSGAGRWRPDSVERCRAGSTPPPADACVAPNFPPQTLEAVPPPPRMVPRIPNDAEVSVLIALDADSNVVDARVWSSPYRELNAAALAAARASKFRTEIRDCKPQAPSYLFLVYFLSG